MSEDPEFVYVSNRGGSGVKAFHTNPEDCDKAQSAKNMSQRRREVMESWGWEECSYCAGEHDLIDGEDAPPVNIRESSVRYQIEDGVYDE